VHWVQDTIVRDEASKALDHCETIALAISKPSTIVTLPRNLSEILGHGRRMQSCPAVVIRTTAYGQVSDIDRTVPLSRPAEVRRNPRSRLPDGN